MSIFLRRLLVMIFIFVIIIGGLLIAIPVLVVINEPKSLKSHFNNNYINENYPGWERKNIPNFDQLMMPETWNVSSQDSIINVTNEKGVLIAQGIVLESGSHFDNNPEYLTALCGTKNQLNISYDFYKGKQTMMGSSNYQIVNISSENQNFSYISARIKSDNTERILWLSFARSEQYDDEIIRSWVEAIIYAHEY